MEPKFGRLTYRYSKAVRLDWFNGALEFLDSPRAFCKLSPSVSHQSRWFLNWHRRRDLHAATRCERLPHRSHHEIKIFLHRKNPAAVGGAPSPLHETHLMPSLGANMLLSPPSWVSELKGLRRFSGALHLGILVSLTSNPLSIWWVPKKARKRWSTICFYCCLFIVSLKTGRRCPTSPLLPPILACPDKSGSSSTLTKTSSGRSSRWGREDGRDAPWGSASPVRSPLKGCSVLLQAFRPSSEKESPVWDLIHTLQQGWSWHRVKPFLTFETRYFQATSLGLPLEISKYYQSVNAITLNGERPVHTVLEVKK